MASTRRIPLFAVALTVAALLIAPAAASAVVYCVPDDTIDPSCDAAQGKATIAAALTAAQSSTTVADTVRIDAGNYSEAGLSFNNTAPANVLTLIGDGTGQTLLTIPDTTGIATGLLVHGPAGSTVSGLSMTVPASVDGNGEIGINLGGAVVGHDLLVDGPSAGNVRGFQLSSTARIDDSAVDLPFASPSNTAVSGSGTTAVSDSDLHANTGVRYGTVERSMIEASIAGVSLDTSSVTVRDTLIDLGANNNAIGVQVANFNNNVNPMTAVVDGVTIVGGGTNSSGIWALADSDATAPIGEPGDTNTDGESATATVSNTVISGPTRALRVEADRGETATVTTSYSNYDPAQKIVNSDVTAGGGTGTASLTETNSTNLAPGFVGGGDFHLAAGSALIDIGDPSDPLPGAIDIDGDAREIFGKDGCDGARRDIGADEFVPASPPTLLDCIPPDTNMLSEPSDPTSDATPTFDFESTESPASFQCSLDAAAFVACDSPFTAPDPLGDGPHTFAVKAIDSSLNEDPTPATSSFTVDTIPPETTILSGPAGTTADATPTFGFDSTEAASTFRCSLDGAPFGPCSSPVTTPSLGDGPHTFAVQAADAALNEDASPATRSFTVDTLVPETIIDSHPKRKTKKRRGTFAFGSSEPRASFLCSYDGKPYAPCGSPFTTPRLKAGKHRFDVLSEDPLGNRDSTAASFRWKIIKRRKRLQSR